MGIYLLSLLWKENKNNQGGEMSGKVKIAREIWCDGCVLRTSYCPDKKKRHCGIVDKAMKELRKLLIKKMKESYLAGTPTSPSWNAAIKKCLEIVNSIFEKD